MNRTMYGDCRTSMRELIAHGVKVQMCVTSPPYWGLRDYGHPGQLGLEPTPAEYIANMVEVFRLVRELLADDGVFWLNCGDSYNAAGRTGHGTRQGFKQGTNRASANGSDHTRPSCDLLKPKDLVGIPWMLAFALRSDGWYLRQDIIWAKPNPMPESVTDRCTKSHEYLFLLAKSERYYYDSDAIAEETDCPELVGKTQRVNYADESKLGRDSVDPHVVVRSETRNKRSVWTVATRPYREAHFATFPPALIEPCILAGSRVGDIVLDPFFGSGTTGQVAQQLGRQWIGCELNEAYGPLQKQRTAQQGMVFDAIESAKGERP